MRKKVVLIILSILVACSAVVVPAGAITQSEFDTKISALRAEYPNYTFWGEKFDNATQCMGFAYLMANRVFGGSAKDWEKSYTLSGVKAGDIIRYSNSSKGHSVFVTGVEGNTICFVDCNGNGGYCKVKWDNKLQIGAKCFGTQSFQYRLVSPMLTNLATQIGVTKPVVSAYEDSAGNNVKLTWEACNLATGYDVRIYDATGNNIKMLWNVQGTSVSMSLPAGSYSADIATLSNGSWRFGSKVAFNVYESQIGVTKPVASAYGDSAGNNVKLTWEACNLATGYDVRIYDATGNNIKMLWNVQGTSVSMSLPAGSYSADIATLSNGSWRFGSRVAFNVYESQIGVTKPVASAYGDSDGNNVKLTWEACNLATGYDVRIYDATGNNIKMLWNVQGTSVSISLPAGSYSADIATLSNGSWRFGSRTAFDVV